MRVLSQYLAVVITAALTAGCGGGGGTSASAPVAPVVAPQTAAPIATVAPTAVPTVPPQGATSVNATPVTVNASVDPRDIAPIIASSNVALPPSVSMMPQRGAVHPLGVFQDSAGNLITRKVSSGQRQALSRRPLFSNSPFDLGYAGGMVLGSAISHNIYISTTYQNCSTTCWGAAGQAVADLGNSSFISQLNPYTGSSTPGRYSKGTSATYTITVLTSAPSPYHAPVLSQSDLTLIMFYASVSLNAFGYGHVYHLFLPPGVDTCLDFGPCYSPDNPSSFKFCGYHSSADYGGIYKYAYTVEPYQDVPGCAIAGGPNASPDGHDLTDSTGILLAHELFETITDPIVGAGWTNPAGNEIADICSAFLYRVTLNGNAWAMPSMWSNTAHDCESG